MTTATLALSAYVRAAASTAEPAEVVRMAYERIITACDRAADASDTGVPGWMQRFHDETTRAQAIIVELAGMLAIQHTSPDVRTMADNLAALYSFALQQLTEANIAKDPAPLDAVRDIIEELHGAWVEAVLH